MAHPRRWLALGAGLLFLMLCAHQILGENGYFDLRARRQELHKLELELRRLGEENQRLDQQIKRLRSDPRAIEQIAREEHKLARPGEVVFTLPAPPEPPPPPQPARPTR